MTKYDARAGALVVLWFAWYLTGAKASNGERVRAPVVWPLAASWAVWRVIQ